MELMMQNNYVLRLEQERDTALQEAERWKRLYQAKVAAEKAPPATVEGLNEIAWGQWVAYRKEIGKRPYKSTQVQKWLAQYPASVQTEIVNQSVRKEWQGLHEIPKSQQIPRYGKPDIEERFL